MTKFGCPIQMCSCAYVRLSDLKSHFSLKHPNFLSQFPEMRSGKYKCFKCGSVFTRKAVRRKHFMQIHRIKYMDSENNNDDMDCSNTSDNVSHTSKISVQFLLNDNNS